MEEIPMTAEQFRIRVLARIDEWPADSTIGPRAYSVLCELRADVENLGLSKVEPKKRAQ